MDPLDFPQVWQRPSFAEFSLILQELELNPPVWNHKRSRLDILAKQESAASSRKGDITRYLSTIIGSPLAWLADDDEREQIWCLAGRRMSERCGRAAMGDVTRRWPLGGDGAGYQPFELIIKEPALTGDSLGLKTWGSSYVLAQHLPKLAETSLFRLFDETLGQPVPNVLELGSGTGLLGLAAAALWRAPITLSDLPEIIPNLKVNAEKNRELVEERGGLLEVGPLIWGGEGDDAVDPILFEEQNKFKIVLAADPIYDDDHPALLASAISQHLAFGSESRAVVMVPQRDEITRKLRDSFKQVMLDLETPLFLEEEGELSGQDDWGEDEEDGLVTCWLGVFSRGGSPPLTTNAVD